MHDNIIATIIFILAIAGLVALVVYKLRKDNNDEKVTVEDFLGLYQTNLFNVLQDVVSLLSININDFETKEDYERAIISTTIAKLEENCDEFGISSALLKLVDRDVLTNILYDILYTNKVQIFFSTLPERIIKDKPELYDEEVIEAFENAEPVMDENDNTHTEPQEEYKHEEEDVTEQEEAVTDASDNEKAEENEAKDPYVNSEKLPPREVYYGVPQKKIEVATEDVFGAEVEIVNDDISYTAELNADETAGTENSVGTLAGFEPDAVFVDETVGMFTTEEAAPVEHVEKVIPTFETAEELEAIASEVTTEDAINELKEAVESIDE